MAVLADTEAARPCARPMRGGRATSTAVALALLTGCAESQGDESTRKALLSALGSAAGTRGQVNLADAVDGDWSRLVFVCPYEDRDVVEDRLGFRWEDFPGQDDAEGFATYVFAAAGDVTTWATVGRDVGDPCGSSDAPRAVPRASAVFALERTDTTTDGKPFYTLVQRR